MFKRKKKIMFTPDEEILAYNQSKNQAEATGTVTEAEASVEAVKIPRANIFRRFVNRFIPKKSDDKKTVIIKSVSIIALIAIVVSILYLAFYFGDVTIQDGKIDNIRNNYTLNKDDYTKNEENQFSKFDILKAQNSDVTGWITIPNTEVNNPFYQTDDNDFYVKNDMDKQPNTYGALFLDYRCSIDPKSLTQNQIIYGHNMRFGAMFGMLDEYRNIDFYKNNPLIYVDSLYERRVYKIFAMMIVSDTEDTTFGYSYSPYRSIFTSESDFMQWIEYSRQRSLFDTNIDIQAQDEIITLSTCCYDFENARFVILGRLVRDGESTEINKNLVVPNQDVLYPKAFYDKKGWAVPQPPNASQAPAK